MSVIVINITTTSRPNLFCSFNAATPFASAKRNQRQQWSAVSPSTLNRTATPTAKINPKTAMKDASP